MFSNGAVIVIKINFEFKVRKRVSNGGLIMEPYIMLISGTVFLSVFLFLRDKNSSVLAIIFKTAVSLCFIATAFAALSGRADEVTKELVFTAGLIIFGLVLGLVGDIFLDFKAYFKSIRNSCSEAVKNHDQVTFFGMISFGLGHILYIAALLIRIPNTYGFLFYSFLISIVATAAIIGLSVFVMKMYFGKFIVPAISYSILLILFAAFTGFNLKSGTGGSAVKMLFIGSLLFLLSDLILSITYFSKSADYEREDIMNPESRLMISVNHITYYAAQFTIALSLMYL